MIPILYEKNETTFTSNGLGRLRDCISCTVVEERNSIYECDFEYPVSGAHYDDIRLGRVIGVEHDDSNDVQPFDIVASSKPIDGVVTFHCVHISYRQSKLVASGTTAFGLQETFAMFGNSTPANPFTYQTDQESTASFPLADGIPRSVREMLGGTEGSVLDTFGGEYEWDKFTVNLWNSRGSETEFTIRYGVNMTEYEDETDSSESYSAIVPYWVGDDGNGGQIVVKGSMITNGSQTVTGRVDCIAYNFTDKFESQPSVADLESLASATLTSKQPNLASQTIKVGFIRIQDSGEYGTMMNLLKCKLCDTVRVEFPRYNMSGRFKIVKTTYDVLLERYKEMELGTLSTTLSEALGIGSVSSSSYSTSGGGGAVYRITKSGDTITLTGSDGTVSSVTDSDTTYGLSLSGTTVGLVAGGATPSVTIPVPTALSDLTSDSTHRTVTDAQISDWSTDANTTYALSKSGDTITLTGSDGATTSVTDSDTTYTDFVGATTSADGAQGLVPEPKTNTDSTLKRMFLSAIGAWRYMALYSSRSTTTYTVGIRTYAEDGTDSVSASATLSSASTSAAGMMSSSDKTKLNGIATGAEVNQDAFSNIAVSGQTTIEADSKTDTLNLVAGSNITITTDASTDSVTISASGGGGGGGISVLDCYPIGSYYETSDSTFNPNTAWGGTWTIDIDGKVVEDKMLLWTNPSPGSGFVGQNVSIPNLGDYRFVDIDFRQGYSTESAQTRRFNVPTAYSKIPLNYGEYFAWRHVGVDSTNNIVGFGSGGWSDYNGAEHAASTGAYSPPLHIYGIKTRTIYRWHRTA